MSRPPSRELTFFIDRDLGSEIFPRILREAGLSIERHVDHFKPDAPDEEWLQAISLRGWYVLTNDKGILRRDIQRDAVIRNGIGLFILVGGHMTSKLLADNFVNSTVALQRFIQEHDAPFIAKVYRPSPISRIDDGHTGKVDLKYP